MREEFHPMKLLWLGYLVYSLDNCVMKLCIETDLNLHQKIIFSILSRMPRVCLALSRLSVFIYTR